MNSSNRLARRLPEALTAAATGTDTRWVVFEPETGDAVSARMPPVDYIRRAPEQPAGVMAEIVEIRAEGRNH